MISLHQETQSDLEVILEFLEEYYKQSSGENGKRKAWIVRLEGHFCSFWHTRFVLSVEKVHWIAEGEPRQQGWTCYEPPVSTETSPPIVLAL